MQVLYRTSNDPFLAKLNASDGKASVMGRPTVSPVYLPFCMGGRGFTGSSTAGRSTEVV